jgi:hypothetical protein
MQLPKTVDRGFVRFMMVKRISTGAICLVGGVGAVVFGYTSRHELHGKQWPHMALLLLICFGGGTWMLRDGLRLRTMLRE